ncbi:MAG: hypothetical protein WAK95_11960 [Desulfobacterales bacterium]
MKHRKSNDLYIYLIDKNDKIISVSNNWSTFAQQNMGATERSPNNVIGSSLWSFIQDEETTHLYEIIIQKIRKNLRPVNIPFRCDSPEERRFLNLSIVPMKNDFITFLSQIVETESRDPVQLLRYNINSSDTFIRICSMCKKIALSETEWREIEDAIKILNLFEKDPLPQLTHGICEPCYTAAMANFEK